ncbi:disease resistance protein Pik-2-like [Triticum dicoccoides]|uniref:disease resistance protein Pik-2-like n=1 Tax=Triticum dicoccoides TaxID=85692 RepID=UPI001891AD5B|nr:disease resistance protein Pik-2-like [Triticum dicoccoides]
MAEFALGLTKSAVEGTLSRVKSAIEEEDKQRVRVQDDLVFITGEFQMMQSFLGVANAERANNPVVRTWVKQLRDLAFDVEDCVEFVIHLDKPSRLDWVRRFTSSVICIARPPLPLDVAVADIKRLKARVEDVSQRNTRYNLISDSGSSSNSAVTSVSTPAVELKPVSTSSLFHTLCRMWEEAGRKRRGTDDLKKLIMREGSDLEVISLWGSQEAADLGTTHVIREAYNDPQIRQEFRIRARVKLLHPFNLDEFRKNLLTQFNLAASSHRQRSSGRSHNQIQAMDGVCETDQLMQHLKEHRYLVILEDVCTAVEWDDIREYLPDTKNGSRIVVSAQQLGLAVSCLRKSCQVAELRRFSHGQSLCAFIKVAFGGKQLSPKEIEVSKLTMDKCGGLPKVIVAIGKQYNASERGIPFLENLNSNFMGTLESMPQFHSLRGLFSWMQSYFDACSDALKPCIFYLSVFPTVNHIRRGRLLRRWIAEGYSRNKFGITADRDGENLFTELVKLSIIQEPPFQNNFGIVFNDPDSKVDNVFQVNGFFHEYIISRPLEDNLVFALEGHCDLDSQRVGQHLTIRSSWDRDEIVFKSMDLSRLRSLTVFGEWRSFFISTVADSSNMRLLRVLDLEDTSGVTNDDLEQIGKLLPRLKYLSVRACKDITRMPDSLGSLRQLQTLDVSHTKITKLSCAIINLAKLQYLCVGTTQDYDAQPAAADHDGMSRSQAAGANHDGMSSSQAAVAVVIPAMDGDVTSTIEPAATTTATTPAEGENSSSTLMQWSRKTRNLVQSYSCSWPSKKKKQFDYGGGVKVHAAGFGNLSALRSLGIVNVSGAGGKAILKEMKKLTQLHNLWVSGINQKNWHSLCSVISGHGHLESLSVRLDYEYEQEGGLCCLDDISELPNTLDNLKLYGGNVRASPAWILGQLLPQNWNHIHLHLFSLNYIELTVSTQEDIDSLQRLRDTNFPCLCVKPIQDGELRYGWEEDSQLSAPFVSATVLKIECNSYKLALVFEPNLPRCVQELVIHCSSTESSLELSGLEKLGNLKEICLKGSYSQELRQYLQQKVDCLEGPPSRSFSDDYPEDLSSVWYLAAQYYTKPVLKLEPQHSAPSIPCASLKRLFT